MIRIMSVQGDVLIEDRRGRSSQMGKPGIIFTSPADLLIVTNDTSRATISVGGREVKLGPMSYLRVRPSGRSWWARHGLAHGGDARRWIGQIWAKIRGPENDDPPGGANMVIGVRG